MCLHSHYVFFFSMFIMLNALCFLCKSNSFRSKEPMLLYRHYAVLIFRSFACLYFLNFICNINPPSFKQLPSFFRLIAFSPQPINNNFKLFFISTVRELAILRQKNLCLIITRLACVCLNQKQNERCKYCQCF